MKTLLTLFALSTVAFAQVDRATVTGTLRDPSGAVVAGGGVTVTYPETGQHRTVSSNGSGVFLAPGLPVDFLGSHGCRSRLAPIQFAFQNILVTKTQHQERQHD